LKRLESEPAETELQRLQRVLESVVPLDDERLALNRIFLYFYAAASTTSSAIGAMRSPTAS
ncbi:hypothetical protein ASJ79_15960, partial [Mycobacterium sp. NAZ190054]